MKRLVFKFKMIIILIQIIKMLMIFTIATIKLKRRRKMDSTKMMKEKKNLKVMFILKKSLVF
jgi:hypothetical protein